MNKTRDNHFVAQWYQKGFMDERDCQLCYVTRRKIDLKNGEFKIVNSKKWHTPAQQFYKVDLYSTFFGVEINDDIEQKLFGPIDDNGSRAIRAFLNDKPSEWHHNFQDLFVYLDAQKLRTPKGLEWIKSKYHELSQLQLMMEMQSLRTIHCTLWAESVRELVSAENSDVKFIISDHPVTIYNYACPPDSELCEYPNDPDISLKGSQTIFPLDKNRCLILTNLEYAQDPNNVNPLDQRTNATRVRQSMVNTIEFINTRKLTAGDVVKINHIIKSRAQSSVAAGKEDWLHPENLVTCDWASIRSVLLPPAGELYRYGGEMYVKFKDGSVQYQDAFGRTNKTKNFLNKNIDEVKVGRNDLCGCGSGRKYKNCCRNIPIDLRVTWTVASIRERNLAFCNCIRSVLGLEQGKTWLDVRRELSNEQIAKIYDFYSVLWPRETDIYSLLPKSDGKFRGLYAGLLDVRVISLHALPMASVFDELLIASPIINPNNVKPEFSPTKSPENFKCQALKDFLFMLEVEPFVELGLVNLIPSPTDFDHDLMMAIMDMAEARYAVRGQVKFREQDLALNLRLQIEDLLNSIAMLPKDVQVRALVTQLGLTEEMSIEAISELEQHSEASPLMLLQKNDFGESGQFMKSSILPNYEMAMFIAQVTGSVLVTDSGSRWDEFISAQHRTQGIVNYPWGGILERLNLTQIDTQFLSSFQRSQGLFATARNILKSVDRMVLDNDRDNAKLVRLAERAASFISQVGQALESVPTSTLTILSPEGGLNDPNVQRLLVRSSCTKYDHKVRSIYGISIQN